MTKLTIHTATYNRAYILGNAYESLKCQTCKDFEWIITDDGSTDGTRELVAQWMKEDNGFIIKYNPLSHVGLPRALNSGIQLASSEWLIRLDSDDYFIPRAVETIIACISEISASEEFVGVGFARCQPDGRYMKDITPLIDPAIGYVDATNLERSKYGLDMDMCEAMRVSILKKFPHRCWPTETFAPEQLSYNEIALAGYKYRWRADKIYVCDYLVDGLTKSDRIVLQNPMGYAMMHNQNMLIADNAKAKLKAAMQMTALSLCSGNPQYLRESTCKWATVLTFPVGAALSVRRKIQFMKMDKQHG